MNETRKRIRISTLIIIQLMIFGLLGIPNHLAAGIVDKRNEIIGNFNYQKDELLKRGYKEKLNGLSVGFVAPDFTVDNRPALLIEPFGNVSKYKRAEANPLKDSIRAGIQPVLIDTGLFASVKAGENRDSADLKLEIVIKNYFRETCTWTINLYDKNNRLVASGSDMVSSSGTEFPLDDRYFSKTIIKRAVRFIASLNPEYKQKRLKEAKESRARKGRR